MYPALLPLMRTPQLPVVDGTDAPADLDGLVRVAERRNLVSARVPSHFNWPLTPYGIVPTVDVTSLATYAVHLLPSMTSGLSVGLKRKGIPGRGAANTGRN